MGLLQAEDKFYKQKMNRCYDLMKGSHSYGDRFFWKEEPFRKLGVEYNYFGFGKDYNSILLYGLCDTWVILSNFKHPFRGGGGEGVLSVSKNDLLHVNVYYGYEKSINDRLFVAGKCDEVFYHLYRNEEGELLPRGMEQLFVAFNEHIGYYYGEEL